MDVNKKELASMILFCGLLVFLVWLGLSGNDNPAHTVPMEDRDQGYFER